MTIPCGYASRRTTVLTTASLILNMLLLLGTVFLIWYRSERCLGPVAGPPTGEVLRICYSRSTWNTEGFLVFANLYSREGAFLKGYWVDDVDVPFDVKQRFSGTLWDPTLKAFVDNHGKVVVSLPDKQERP